VVFAACAGSRANHAAGVSQSDENVFIVRLIV
jgi:hypothetical protein